MSTATALPDRRSGTRPTWLRGGIRIGLLALLCVAIVVAVAVFSRTSGVPLDPDNDTANGGEALAVVLQDHGIQLTTVHRPQDVRVDSDTTLVITRASTLSLDQLAALRQQAPDARRIVLVGPNSQELRQFGIDTSVGTVGAGVQQVGRCDIDWAQGLTLSTGEQTYKDFASDETGSTTCFTGVSGAASLLVAPATDEDPELVVIGATPALTNAHLAEEDNAALAIRALGSAPKIVWLSPDVDALTPSEADGGPKWPHWLVPAIWLLLVTLVLLAVWRGRRFGRLVREPLPVIVKASETTRSRGELYRRARDLPRTAAVLRRASIGRLRRTLAVPPGAHTTVVVDRVAAATARPHEEVGRLLYGDPPASEDELTSLAEELRTLERQVQP